MEIDKKFYLKIYLIVCFTILFFIYYASVYTTFEYSIYDLHYKPRIEQHMENISKNITQTSNTDIEKTQKIIQWENELNLKQFNILSKLDRHRRIKSNKTSWYVYLKKGNCREKSLIFEEMANKTNLTYRRIEIDGFIDPNNFRTSNHRWDEVWLDGDWRIADSGFSLYYPKNNNSVFTLEKGFLIGHVAVLDSRGKYIEDRTNSYVNKTGQLIITAKNDREYIENADVSIKLNYKNITSNVVGENLKVHTNEFGFYEINLGIYGDTYYIVNISSGDLHGEKNVTLINEKTFLIIELD